MCESCNSIQYLCNNLTDTYIYLYSCYLELLHSVAYFYFTVIQEYE
jgi:hypothetical protein